MIVTTAKLPGYISECMEADLVPFIKGPPAIGKSDIVRQVAEEYNLKVLDFRLSQADTTDLNGLPSYTEDGLKATFKPMDTFPIDTDPLPVKADGTQYDGWLLFLDELNSAPLAIQAAAFKVVLDRQVGQHNLHSHVRIVAAGNREIDKAITNRMSTPMQSRLAHFELKIDHKAWLKWAGNHGIDYRIMSFIGFKPEILYNFKPDHNKETYASPRTWEFCNRLVVGRKDIGTDRIPLMAAVIDEVAAREFYSYAKIFKSLITIPQIIANPKKAMIPEEPGTIYALTGTIGYHMKGSNAEKLMEYVERLPIEFQILALQVAIKRDQSEDRTGTKILSIPSIKSWIREHSQDLF